jgi:hypothetical protein
MIRKLALVSAFTLVVACGKGGNPAGFLGSIVASDPMGKLCMDLQVDGSPDPKELQDAKDSLKTVAGYSPDHCDQTGAQGSCFYSKAQGAVTASVTMYGYLFADIAPFKQACTDAKGSWISK